ncbi:conserved hypothetical protein [Gammaproteobacteria bacterium]
MKMINEASRYVIVAIRKAERIVGSATKLVQRLGVSRQRFNYWKQSGEVPYEIAVQIYVITDGKVTIEELCPKFRFLTKQMKGTFLKTIKEQLMQFVQSLLL